VAISKESIPQNNSQSVAGATGATNISKSSRPTGVVGNPLSSRPTGVVGMNYINDGLIDDEMKYGRIVKIIKATPKNKEAIL